MPTYAYAFTRNTTKTQKEFFWAPRAHYLRHGGNLRKSRYGRRSRALSTKDPLHVVFKIEKRRLKGSLRSPKVFTLTNKIIQRYAQRFFVKIEQLAVEKDHIHILVRTSRRSHFLHFFRVVSGQIAQQIQKESLLVTDTQKDKRKKGTKLWKHRPYTRIVRGWKAFITAMNYVRLNLQEAEGKIPYRKSRLRGLSTGDWEILWS